mmetsp:Transcript_73735/g.227895  ORF Transcript_73735/g.227895 Transcript_73735/m.227895 type:complete len:207 (-) Transcript_73735:650-1270(-)
MPDPSFLYTCPRVNCFPSRSVGLNLLPESFRMPSVSLASRSKTLHSLKSALMPFMEMSKHFNLLSLSSSTGRSCSLFRARCSSSRFLSFPSSAGKLRSQLRSAFSFFSLESFPSSDGRLSRLFCWTYNSCKCLSFAISGGRLLSSSWTAVSTVSLLNWKTSAGRVPTDSSWKWRRSVFSLLYCPKLLTLRALWHVNFHLFSSCSTK